VGMPSGFDDGAKRPRTDASNDPLESARIDATRNVVFSPGVYVRVRSRNASGPAGPLRRSVRTVRVKA